MTDRVALVTGAARGIGRAVVKVLSERGHAVHGVDLREQPLSESIEPHTTDVSDPDRCQRLIDQIRPDVLVNNAAILITKPIEEFSIDEFDQTIDVNLKSVFTLSKVAAPVMAARGWGRIINMSSVGARTGGVSQSAVYNATKAAIISLTKNLARNFGPSGVTANAIAPGATETAMTSHLTDEQREAYLAQIPLRRFAAPREIATAVAFLASDDASYVNGATLDVNGGWLMT